jgi:predicted CXXCH cytochrome family protein
MNCLSCHEPHASQFPNVLLADPARALCIRCHEGGENPAELRKGAAGASR